MSPGDYIETHRTQRLYQLIEVRVPCHNIWYAIRLVDNVGVELVVSRCKKISPEEAMYRILKG